MNSAQNSNGFTLIELLIVVSIITILSGVMLPGFSSYITNQSKRQAIDQVEDDLRSLENKALSGDSALELINGADPVYWGVRFEQNLDRYQYFISTANNNCYPTPATTYVAKGQSTKLPGGNVIITATRCAFFSFANSDVNMRSSTGSNIGTMVIIIGPPTGNSCSRVQIFPSGLIEVRSNNTSCT